jgi:hypothetical protein
MTAARTVSDAMNLLTGKLLGRGLTAMEILPLLGENSRESSWVF